MLRKVQELLNRLESGLDQIKSGMSDPEKYAQQSLETVIEHLNEVNELLEPFSIFYTQGREVQHGWLNQKTNVIPIELMTSGTYLLKIGTTMQPYRFVKE